MTLREMIEKGMRIQCLDMDKKFGFDGLCKNELLGEAQVDLSALLTKRAVKLKVPLNTQGVITLTVSWDGEDPDGQPIDELAEAARKIEEDGASHEERHSKSMKEIADLRA